MKKLLLISLLVLVALALSGCTQNLSVCGDGVCSMDESNPDLGSFCVSDCSKEINAKGGEGLNRENCTYNGESYCKAGQPSCCNGVCYNPATMGCCKTTKNPLGITYALKDRCCRAANGGVYLFNRHTWKPSTNTVCQGEPFCQTNDCLEERTETGTNPALCCVGGNGNYGATFEVSTNYGTVSSCFQDKPNQGLNLIQKAQSQNEKVEEMCKAIGGNCIFTPGVCAPNWDPDCVRGGTLVVSLIGNCNMNPTCGNPKYKQCSK